MSIDVARYGTAAVEEDDHSMSPLASVLPVEAYKDRAGRP